MAKPRRISEPTIDSEFDLNSLLHPASAFDHPLDVVRDPDLTLNEKRAILASWASDACAVELRADAAQAARRQSRHLRRRCRRAEELGRRNRKGALEATRQTEASAAAHALQSPFRPRIGRHQPALRAASLLAVMHAR